MLLLNKYFSKNKIFEYFLFFTTRIMLPIVFITSGILSINHKDISIMSTYFLYRFAILVLLSLLLLIKRNSIETLYEKIEIPMFFLGILILIFFPLEIIASLGNFNFPWYVRISILLSIGLFLILSKFQDKVFFRYGYEKETNAYLDYLVNGLKIDKIYSLRRIMYDNAFKFNEYQKEKIIDSFKIIILVIDKFYIVDENIPEKYVSIYKDCINFLEELTLVASKYSDLDLSDNHIFDEIYEDAIQFAEVNKEKIEIIAKKDIITLTEKTKFMLRTNIAKNTR